MMMCPPVSQKSLLIHSEMSSIILPFFYLNLRRMMCKHKYLEIESGERMYICIIVYIRAIKDIYILIKVYYASSGGCLLITKFTAQKTILYPCSLIFINIWHQFLFMNFYCIVSIRKIFFQT